MSIIREKMDFLTIKLSKTKEKKAVYMKMFSIADYNQILFSL